MLTQYKQHGRNPCVHCHIKASQKLSKQETWVPVSLSFNILHVLLTKLCSAENLCLAFIYIPNNVCFIM